MANVKATSSGSGVFSKQTAEKQHLLTHGVSAEVADVRLDVAAALSPEMGVTVDEWDGPGLGNIMILSQTAKLRMGAALVQRELLDGALVSPVTGTITQPGGPGTPWQYNPTAPPNASTAGVVTGSADLSVAGVYGAGGTLQGLTLILTVNGVLNTITFNNVINPLNPPIVDGVTILKAPPTLLDLINAAFPGLTATLNGSHFLVLTNKLKGTTQTIVVGAGTGNAVLGLTPATTAGTGHSYAIHYEYDGTQVKDASGNVVGAPPYVNNYQGP